MSAGANLPEAPDMNMFLSPARTFGYVHSPGEIQTPAPEVVVPQPKNIESERTLVFELAHFARMIAGMLEDSKRMAVLDSGSLYVQISYIEARRVSALLRELTERADALEVDFEISA